LKIGQGKGSEGGQEEKFGLRKFKVSEIKEVLKKRGLWANVKKAKLIARLEAHLANALTSVIELASSPLH
jgi:hypothetical protein